MHKDYQHFNTATRRGYKMRDIQSRWIQKERDGSAGTNGSGNHAECRLCKRVKGESKGKERERERVVVTRRWCALT